MGIKKERLADGYRSVSPLVLSLSGQGAYLSGVSFLSGARSCSAGSMRSTVMPSTWAMACTTSMVTAYLPASMRLTWVRCSPASCASCSWVSPLSRRRVAMRPPMRSAYQAWSLMPSRRREPPSRRSYPHGGQQSLARPWLPYKATAAETWLNRCCAPAAFTLAPSLYFLCLSKSHCIVFVLS